MHIIDEQNTVIKGNSDGCICLVILSNISGIGVGNMADTLKAMMA